jgi:hypothetical protein
MPELTAPRRTARIEVLWAGAFLLAALLAVSCGTDGPVGFVPGGPFSGVPEQGPEPDWSFATELDSVDIQVFGDEPRTVRTGIVVLEGVPHLPVTWSPLKRWPDVVKADPRILLRADGRLFERHAVPVDEPEQLAVLIAAGQEKYGAPFHARWTTGITQYFRLDPGPVDR